MECRDSFSRWFALYSNVITINELNKKDKEQLTSQDKKNYKDIEIKHINNLSNSETASQL